MALTLFKIRCTDVITSFSSCVRSTKINKHSKCTASTIKSKTTGLGAIILCIHTNTHHDSPQADFVGKTNTFFNVITLKLIPVYDYI